jgi:alkylhydroperoxidase/carboxymuconolactone decarboxylase family protein YurZ
MIRCSPAFFDGYTAFSSAPWKTGALAPAVKELLYLAINAATQHLFLPGIRLHLRNALNRGATPEQILQVIQIASCIGMQSYLMATPLLAHQLEDPSRGA